MWNVSKIRSLNFLREKHGFEIPQSIFDSAIFRQSGETLCMYACIDGAQSLTSFDPLIVDIQKYWSGTCNWRADSYAVRMYELSGLMKGIRDFREMRVQREIRQRYRIDIRNVSNCVRELSFANNISAKIF